MEQGGRRRQGRVSGDYASQRAALGAWQRQGARGAMHPGIADLHAPRGADSLLRSEAAALGVLPACRVAVHPPLSV